MHLSRFFKFEFGCESERTLKTTALADGETTVYDTQFVETAVQLDEAREKFDKKAVYLNDVSVLTGRKGRECVAFLDGDGDGLYDGYVSIVLTAYVVNGNRPTLELNGCTRAGVNEEDGSYYASCFSTSDMMFELIFWAHETDNGCSSLVIFPFYPEIEIV